MRIAGATVLLVAAIGAIMLRRDRLPVARLADGMELRVLKVSEGTRHYFSEEIGWRRFANDFLPQSLLRKIGLVRSEFELPHGGLVLWVTKFDSQKHARTQPRVKSAHVEFADQRRACGRLSLISSNVLQIEFPIYPRGDREFIVRLVDDAREASFAVKNRQPVKLSQWQAGRFPQTNVSAHAIITLESEPKWELLLRLRDPEQGSVGWTQWRVEVEDTAGNYEQFLLNGSRLRQISDHVYQPGPLKLTVQAREYLSAGFVTNRAAGVIQEMETNQRAAKLGFEKLFFLGPSTDYLVTNGVPSVHAGPRLRTNELMQTTNSARQWDVHLAVQQPGSLVAIYPQSTKIESFEARLRERTWKTDGGAIFTSYRPPIEASSWQRSRLLRQFDAPLFYSTNAIQAEIIARHRPVEFIIPGN